jgi:glycine reductase
MSGAPAEHSPYARLLHLVVIPRIRREGVHSAHRAIRNAGLRTAVYLAQIGSRTPNAHILTFEPVGPALSGREGLPRAAYVGQIFSRQRRPEIDEGILYGTNTDGMLPVLLHPEEWLDGAVLPSYLASMSGVQTYFYQNHPVILELYRRHRARQLNFVGTVATIAATDNTDRERNCRTSAHLVKWALGADCAVLTKYGGGAPHADLAETARLLEEMGVRTAVMATDVARDRRMESALLFNTPEIDAVVYCGGMDTRWQVEPVDRIVAGSSTMAEVLAGIRELRAQNVAGVTNLQGASRLGVAVY